MSAKENDQALTVNHDGPMGQQELDAISIRACPACLKAFSQTYQDEKCPHPFMGESYAREQMTKFLFHTLWGRAVHQPGYAKLEWMALQLLLQSWHLEV